ncbi:MAG: thioredoxin fold domain-containing protein [Alphaproteobacteria bacterium]|nr:thioredoxin fold domain-containing protein [Alphaproteobacteria bacterium]
MTRITSLLKNSALALTGAFILAPSAVHAQDLLPSLPAPLQTLVNQGAQVRYLGKDGSVDGWVMIKNGQEQYFYVLPNNQGFISGILMSNDGKVLTVEQVRRLRGNGDDLLDTLTADFPKVSDGTKPDTKSYELKTPAEQMFSDIEGSNWIPVGKAGTPVFYAFVDPQCPHCHKMMEELRPYVDKGLAQVRLIPVGLNPETKAQAAFLLAAPDPAGTWWRYMDGDADALPAKSEINQQGIQRNLAIMTSWKFQGTPAVIYRAKDESVKIIAGRPNNLSTLISDLGARS